MVKKAIWLSYDFGLKGDYSGLYAWLDTFGASECGNGLAHIKLDLGKENLPTDLSNEVLTTYIEKNLKEYVKLSKTDRIYLIWRDSNSQLIKGRFINGNRKQPPWEGYGRLANPEITDDGE